MKIKYDKWLRSALAPSARLDDAARARVDSALRGAMLAESVHPARRSRRVFAWRAIVVLAVFAAAILVQPSKLGGGSRDLAYLLSDEYGVVHYSNPISGSVGADADMSRSELEESSDIRAANLGVFTEVTVTRFRGQEQWTAWERHTLASGRTIWGSATATLAATMPVSTLDDSNLELLVPHLAEVESAYQADRGTPLPPVRLVVRGQTITIDMRRFTFPGIGDVDYGQGRVAADSR